MKISARNQIQTAVMSVDRGAVNASITLKTEQGTELTAVITNQSVETLSIAAGESVTAFFKASHVLIATGAVPNISARNKLPGRVAKIDRGVVNSEVDIVLAGGDTVVAIITNEAVSELALKAGDEVVAIIKSTDVMIAK